MTARRDDKPHSARDEEVPGVALQRTFGENFKAARLAASLSQQQIAERSGVDRVEVSKIERGMINLTLRTMDRLAKVVDHDAVHLLQAVPPTKATRRS